MFDAPVILDQFRKKIDRESWLARIKKLHSRYGNSELVPEPDGGIHA